MTVKRVEKTAAFVELLLKDSTTLAKGDMEGIKRGRLVLHSILMEFLMQIYATDTEFTGETNLTREAIAAVMSSCQTKNCIR